jgi:hypothetical protein
MWWYFFYIIVRRLLNSSPNHNYSRWGNQVIWLWILLIDERLKPKDESTCLAYTLDGTLTNPRKLFFPQKAGDGLFGASWRSLACGHGYRNNTRTWGARPVAVWDWGGQGPCPAPSALISTSKVSLPKDTEICHAKQWASWPCVLHALIVISSLVFVAHVIFMSLVLCCARIPLFVVYRRSLLVSRRGMWMIVLICLYVGRYTCTRC